MNDKLEELKKSILVFDIETCASYLDGTPINIRTNFEDYVKYAKCKWFGCYSYKYNQYVCDEVKGNEEKIKNFIAEHNILVGFNNEEFDTPILYNNSLIPEEKKYLQADCLVILGSSTYQRHDGLPFKNRGQLMGYKFKKNSLKEIAKTMELETQKGDIDYNIFFQDTYIEEERQKILKYLESDVKATKEMFDKLWDYWMPFTNFISEKNIMNLSWIRSSIASLRYKGDCFTMGVEETYGEPSEVKEKMGGNVIDPKYEEAKNVIYLDFSSLYPWIRNMFGIDCEVDLSDEIKIDILDVLDDEGKLFRGNELFKVKGFYDTTTQHPIAIKSINNLKLRKRLKKEDPDNPFIYAIKIYENAGYGAMRSPIFEQIHTPNAGWDICWLGQQLQELVKIEMEKYGFETIAGDTDSVFVIGNSENFPELSSEPYSSFIEGCLQKILDKIKENVPFPSDDFTIDIEGFLDYVMWPFSEQNVIGPDGKNLKNDKGRLIKERKGLKKNYVYIEKGKVKVVGLAIKKDDGTPLGKLIYSEKINPSILESGRAKFSRTWMDEILRTYLSRSDSLSLLAKEYRVKPANKYKPQKNGEESNVIQAQISRGYFNGQDGVISLIKNNDRGKAGKTAKYCTVEEALEFPKLEMKDIDLTKVKNELEPFVEDIK